MNIYKKWIILSLSICAFIMVALSTLLYIYDPLQFYHKPYFRKETFSRDMRVQAKGIIDNYDFDSIIIGNSMLENTSAKEAHNKLRGRWMNLSLGGSIVNERAVILNYAFKKKEIKNIIYSLDILGDSSKIKDTSRFENIYDSNNFFAPFRIYMDLKHPKFLICALTYSSKCIGKEESLEKLMSWIEGDLQHFGGFENWEAKNYYLKKIAQLDSKNDFNPPKSTDIEKNKAILQEYLLSFVQKNPNVNFYFVIPTYSRFSYRLNDNKDFTLRKALLKWFIKETSKYPNVKIYGFDDLDYADDIANYKDANHYNADMNSMQLDAIKNNTHMLTSENIDSYFDTMEEKIKAFDLEPFKQKAKEVLDENKP